MTPEVSKCLSCKHKVNLYQIPPVCTAFPFGIPESIFYDGEPHDKPIKDQKNDIIFEPIK